MLSEDMDSVTFWQLYVMIKLVKTCTWEGMQNNKQEITRQTKHINHFWTCNVDYLRIPWGKICVHRQSINLLYCPSVRALLCSLRVHQTTCINKISVWVNANFPTSVQTCRPIQALHAKRPFWVFKESQQPAKWKSFSNPLKMSSSFHPKATFLRVVAFTSNSSVTKMITAAHVPEIYFRKFQEEIGKFWVIAGLSLLPMQEFLPFWALFCKSYYPPADLMQGSVYCANLVTSDWRNAPKSKEITDTIWCLVLLDVKPENTQTV